MSSNLNTAAKLVFSHQIPQPEPTNTSSIGRTYLPHSAEKFSIIRSHEVSGQVYYANKSLNQLTDNSTPVFTFVETSVPSTPTSSVAGGKTLHAPLLGKYVSQKVYFPYVVLWQAADYFNRDGTIIKRMPNKHRGCIFGDLIFKGHFCNQFFIISTQTYK